MGAYHAGLAILSGGGQQGGSQGELAHAFARAIRDLCTEVGNPDHSEVIRRKDFDDLTEQAVAEGMGYPVPRLLE